MLTVNLIINSNYYIPTYIIKLFAHTNIYFTCLSLRLLVFFHSKKSKRLNRSGTNFVLGLTWTHGRVMLEWSKFQKSASNNFNLILKINENYFIKSVGFSCTMYTIEYNIYFHIYIYMLTMAGQTAEPNVLNFWRGNIYGEHKFFFFLNLIFFFKIRFFKFQHSW